MVRQISGCVSPRLLPLLGIIKHRVQPSHRLHQMVDPMPRCVTAESGTVTDVPTAVDRLHGGKTTPMR